MRTEKEMYDLIIGVAEKDERIRAVYLNGSRANPNVPRDIFQDYDVVYVVKETKPFIVDKTWLSVFGEIVVMQEPDLSVLFEDKVNMEEHYAYLMQFMDGNRIDLSLQTIEPSQKECSEEKLTVILLDKDDILPKLPSPSDLDYHVKKPTKEQFDHCCNEFWWVSPYVAKGLWRKEILFALDHMNHYVRPMLLMMLSWHAGIRTDYSVSIGKCGKYLDHYIPSELWNKLLKTYADAEEEHIWTALLNMGELFQETAVFVGDSLGFCYDFGQDEKTLEFLKDIRKLPRDAKDIR